MRARLVPLLLLWLPAFAASPDMQWQAPRILPPKGEAASASANASASAPAASSAPARPAAGAAASAGKSASAQVLPMPAGASSMAKAAAAGAPSASAAKPHSAPELAAKIKEKLEATQLPAPKHSRQTERSANSSFMTQEEFRARLAAAAANAKSSPAATPRVLNVMNTKKAAAVSAAAIKPSVRPGHWSYSGEAGPEHWADLSPEWARCGNGKRQSPIDIREGFKLELEAPLFEYQSSRFSVLDNGHTIQVNINTDNAITIMGRRFQLAQFHFHRPSEERLEGRGFEMVMHLVHKDDAGRLAVVAVMIERGEPNAQVQAVWNNLPLEKNESLTAAHRLDLEQLLPARREYYTYMGSLTTPPCSEGVLWVVMKQPITLSPQQIGIFARLYPMNARPLQAAGDRLIKESN